MLDNEKLISKQELLPVAEALLKDGNRLVTITCLDLNENHEINYHFDKNYILTNLRLTLKKDEPITSISKIYFAAAVVENEIKDLFGVNFTELAIDYGGRFVLTEDAPTTPLNKNCGLQVNVKTIFPKKEDK